MHTTAASAAGCLLYLAVFLVAGWLAARRALPGAPAAVAVPLGCAFGVSFLAALPALAALALGFTPGAALAGGAAALALALVLRFAPGFVRMRPRFDRDTAAAAACVSWAASSACCCSSSCCLAASSSTACSFSASASASTS